MDSDTLPVKYIRVDFEKLGLEKHRNEALTKIVATLPQDVSWRFMRVNGCEYPLYQLDRSGRRLTFRGEHIRLIAEYSDFLLDAISYRWTQMLEKFNHSPRIAQKVRGVAGDKEPRRGNLTKFRKYLDMDDVTSDTCFQCRRRILDKAPDTSQKPSVDHVIPWSFMYSDDLWNLAYCHTGCNSSKSNRIPNSDTIERLEARNKRLLEHLPKRKVHSEMQMAIENNYLRRFWISFKG